MIKTKKVQLFDFGPSTSRGRDRPLTDGLGPGPDDTTFGVVSLPDHPETTETNKLN